jgi:hypothetical protein
MVRYFAKQADNPPVYYVGVLYYSDRMHYSIRRDSWESPSGGTEVTEENWIYKISNLVDAIIELVEGQTNKRVFRMSL